MIQGEQPWAVQGRVPGDSPTHEHAATRPVGLSQAFVQGASVTPYLIFWRCPHSLTFAWSGVCQGGKQGFSLFDLSRQEPRGFYSVFLSDLLNPGPEGPCGPLSPFLPPCHTFRGCIGIAGQLFANQVSGDCRVTSVFHTYINGGTVVLWEESGADSFGAFCRCSCQGPLFPPGLASHQPNWQQLHNK